MSYTREEKLSLEKQVRVTKDVYNILREQKRKQKLSMAKIVCNLILNTYEHSGTKKQTNQKSGR